MVSHSSQSIVGFRFIKKLSQKNNTAENDRGRHLTWFANVDLLASTCTTFHTYAYYKDTHRHMHTYTQTPSTHRGVAIGKWVRIFLSLGFCREGEKQKNRKKWWFLTVIPNRKDWINRTCSQLELYEKNQSTNKKRNRSCFLYHLRKFKCLSVHRVPEFQREKCLTGSKWSLGFGRKDG